MLDPRGDNLLYLLLPIYGCPHTLQKGELLQKGVYYSDAETWEKSRGGRRWG